MSNMQIIKTTIATFTAIALTGAASFTSAEVVPLDRVVAVVDNRAITQTELDSRVQDVQVRSQAAGMRLPEADILNKQIIDQLISETLQLEMADRYGVQVSDQEVNASIGNIIQNAQITEQQFVQQLASEGVSINEFRATIRRQLTMRSITEGLVSRRIRISEQEVDNFLKSADAQFWVSPDYHLGHILVALPSSPSSEAIVEAEEKANALYEKLKAGANFAEVAIAESNGPSALQGGDLGWRKSAELPTLFAELLPSLNNGDVTKPTRSQAGFHIIKLYESRGGQKQIVNQTRARHILVKTSEILNDAKAEAKLKEIRQQILDGADFAELAKTHSEDIGSRMSGGDLGWATPGTFVPAFEKTMAETKEGEISQPFKSRFGWHIMKVEERREEDMTQEALRQKARNMIMSRRFEDETQIWLQELRDEAFIDIKI